jgi:N-acetylneuraminate lyase
MPPQQRDLDIWAAAPTPFDTDGRLDLGAVGAQVAHLADAGVDGVLVAGTTGEFWALSVAERMSLAAAWAEHRPPGLRLGIHVGHTNLADARELACHAADLSVDMVASVAPYYGQVSEVAAAVDWLAVVADAAPSTPMCYYHIPSWTGLDLDPAAVARLAVERVPTFAAVKFTDADLMNFEAVATAAPGATVYFGKDELLPAAIASGAEHVIGSLYNFLAPVARQVWAYAESGDLAAARRAHTVFRDVARVCDALGGLPAIKALNNRLAPDAGPTRLPLRVGRDADGILDELATRILNTRPTEDSIHVQEKA